MEDNFVAGPEMNQHAAAAGGVDIVPSSAGGEGGPSTVAAAAAGGESSNSQSDKGKRKRFHRHTPYQIDGMEGYFKNCPNPSETERNELAQKLGMEPTQVRFWFQNKRTLIKSHDEREQMPSLKARNDELKALNASYKEGLRNNSCPCAGSFFSREEKLLKLKNDRFKKETGRLRSLVASYIAGEVGDNSTLNLITGPLPEDLKETVEYLVATSTEELKVMALASGPLWTPSSLDGTTFLLDEVEYIRSSNDTYGPTSISFKSECSKQIGIVMLSLPRLIEVFMNVNEWSVMFSPIILRAKTLEVLNHGADYDGALHVMVAEYQIPTPLVPTREVYFARYIKKQFEGVWIVVDVSLDNVHPMKVTRCHKKPSGCLMQSMSDDTTKVTWIEHIEVDYQGVSSMYKDLLASGLGFGAKRWVSTLDRRSQRAAFTLSRDVPTTDFNNLLISSPKGRRGLLKLAERMMSGFTSGISNSKSGIWNKVHGDFTDDIRLMMRRNADDPSLPIGTLISASTSFSLPVPPTIVFNYLSDHSSRSQWDVLSIGMILEPACHISTGEQAAENYVSILKVHTEDTCYDKMLLLQECCSDPTSSYIVYASGVIGSINVVLSGGDPNDLPLLPCGFAVLPDGPSILTGGIGGSLLTVSYQILINKSPNADIHVGAISKVTTLLKQISDRIKAAFLHLPLVPPRLN